VYCKSAYHAKKSRENKPTLFKTIDKQLKQNRRLLQHFNHAGKSTIRKEKLLQAGFDPQFLTHYWKNSKGDVYLFCYEYGYLSRKERGITKYILIEWQDYMEKKKNNY
jgi:hypothetical protein